MSSPTVRETRRTSPYYTPARAGEPCQYGADDFVPMTGEHDVTPEDSMREEMRARGIL
jgi:hypothetical protein